MDVLTFEQVSYAVSHKKIIDNISFSVQAGEYVSIVGPSGSGKSTLLKLCSDLISPTEGVIRYKGTPLDEMDPSVYRKAVGYCFQRPYLFARTVRRNVLFPFDIRNVKPDMHRIEELFDVLKMPLSYLDRGNEELSGGEMQRICLIRSLIFEPEVLLLDEITSALDPYNAHIVETAIEDLHAKGMTVISVTHNEEQSLRNANRRMTVLNGSIASWEVL